jgi:hypothetical protein
LRHELRAAPQRQYLPVADVLAVHEDAAGVDVQEPVDKLKQRGLAATGGADDPEPLGPAHDDVQAGEDWGRVGVGAVAGAQRLADVFALDHRFHRRDDNIKGGTEPPLTH